MKPTPFLELQSQLRAIDREVRAAIDEVLDSGWFILGEQLRAFEAEFAAYVGTSHALGVANGTDAIQLALMAFDIGRGDEVITAGNTCVPTVTGIICAGATPVLAECHPETLTLDPSKLDAAITKRTKAIVPVHLYGHPCDMDPIREIANRHGVVIAEDCAQAHGARYKGVMCGNFGHAAAFSFYPSKNLGALGDGGAVVTNDVAASERLVRLRNYGKSGEYDHASPGINSRLDELQAAILRVKLRHLDAWNAARRERAQWYDEALDRAPITRPYTAPWAESCHHLYAIRSPHRDAMREHLAKHGVATQIHYPRPIHLVDAFRHLASGPGSFPVAEHACAETLSLPLYPELSREQVDYIARLIHDFKP